MADLPTTEELTIGQLEYYEFGLIAQGNDPAVAAAACAAGSEVDLRLRSTGSQLGLLRAYLAQAEDERMADTAQGDALLKFAAAYGVYPDDGSGAVGNVIANASPPLNVSQGSELIINNIRYATTATTLVGVGTPVPVTAVDVGKATEQAPGAVLAWSAPPSGLDPNATVDGAGLRGGSDTDTEEDVRAKLKKRLATPATAGNSAHILEWVDDASSKLVSGYVYPALKGPATVRVVLLGLATQDNLWSRSVPAALLQAVAAAIVARTPEHVDVVTGGAAHQDLDVTLGLKLNEPPSGGGAGGGWVDPVATRWPSTEVAIASVVSPKVVNIGAASPVNTARISIWRQSTRSFKHVAVESYSNPNLTLSEAVEALSPGDVISATAVNADAYAEHVCSHVGSLAPSQLSSDTLVLERAQRRPLDSISAVTSAIAPPGPVSVTVIAPASLPSEPSVPAGPDNLPNVWRVRKLAFRPL